MGPGGCPCSLHRVPPGRARGVFLPQACTGPWPGPAGAWRPAPLDWRVMHRAEQAVSERSAFPLAFRNLAPRQIIATRCTSCGRWHAGGLCKAAFLASTTSPDFPVAVQRRPGSAPRASPWGRAMARTAPAVSLCHAACPLTQRDNEKTAGLIWPMRWQLASVRAG